MSEVNAWNVTAASNNSAVPDGWPENMARSGVNNSARENMAVIKRWQADTNGSLTSGGSANAHTIAANRTTTSAYAGESFSFKAGFTNTGATTVNITPSGGSARGVVAIQRNGAALTGGEITAGGMYTIRYDGTVYQLSDAAEHRMRNQSLQAFDLQVFNDAGTMKHRIRAAAGVNATFADKISGATSGDTTTPTGADASTAMSGGGKISSADTSIFILDTAAQTVADRIGHATIGINTAGTALSCDVAFTSRDVNGTTRIRLELSFLNAATGAAFGLTTANISAGNSVRIQFLGYLA